MNARITAVCRWVRWFVGSWNRDRWELVVLSIPLARGLLFLAHLAPAQLADEVVPEPWQLIMLGLLGVAALTGIVGALGERPIVERTGLHALGPFSVIYGIASITSDPHRGAVTLVVYGMVAACCFTRAHEITKAMRIVNRTLGDGTEHR